MPCDEFDEDAGNNRAGDRDGIKMNRFFIDHNALELIKKELAKENAHAMRIFTGGGCCSRFEIAPVKKALAGDVAFTQGGIKVYMEEELAESAPAIEIKLDGKKGLIIELRE
jgi:Fe-S cluster assembly iron-binding protein IscA